MNAPFSAEALHTFGQTLLLMLQGMGGVFIFMLVFYGLVLGLNRWCKDNQKRDA